MLIKDILSVYNWLFVRLGSFQSLSSMNIVISC